MATKKLTRMPYTPQSMKPEWTNQTIRLSVRDNRRLKRAAKRRKMTFNAWAVQTLIETANQILNPLALEQSLDKLRALVESQPKQ
jgi:uncharacterized protein (DUF1778 family)